MLSKEQIRALESIPGWKEFCKMSDEEFTAWCEKSSEDGKQIHKSPDSSTHANAVAKDHTLDLHGYPVQQALEVAEEKVKEAWEKGWGEVTLIHGAPDIRHWQTALAYGRGGLSGVCEGCCSGERDQYVYPRRSRRHRICDGTMTLAVRQKEAKGRNTSPRVVTNRRNDG